MIPIQMRGGGRLVPVASANFLTTTALPSWLTWTNPAGHRTMFDSSGYLTFAPNNLVFYSNNFTDSFWGAECADVTLPGGVTTPSGAQANLWTPANGKPLNAATALSGNIGSTSLYSEIWYIEVKANGISVLAYQDGDGNGISINLSTVAVGVLGGATNATITLIDDGWYGISCKMPVKQHPYWYMYPAGGGTANGTDGIYISSAVAARVTYETSVRAADKVITTSAAYYGPRFDTDPATLLPRGLLIEESRVNNVLYSNTFSNAAWGNDGYGAPVAENVGPDNVTNSSWTFTESAGTDIHRNYTATPLVVTGSNGLSRTISLFVKPKAGTRRLCLCLDDGAGNGFGAVIDTSGVVSGGAATGTGTYVNADAETLANGWFRFWVSGTIVGNSGYYTCQFYNSSTFDGTGTANGVYSGSTSNKWEIYGFTVETGASGAATSFATSYIPTTTAAVTRNAETVTFAGTAQTLLQSAIYSSVMEFVSESSSDASRLIGNTTNTASPIYRVSSTAIGAHNATTSLSAATAVTFDTTTYRVAYGQNASGRSITSNNTAVSTGTDANYTAANAYTWRIGQYSGSEKWSGWVRFLSFYNTRLNDAQLKTLSDVGTPTTGFLLENGTDFLLLESGDYLLQE